MSSASTNQSNNVLIKSKSSIEETNNSKSIDEIKQSHNEEDGGDQSDDDEDHDEEDESASNHSSSEEVVVAINNENPVKKGNSHGGSKPIAEDKLELMKKVNKLLLQKVDKITEATEIIKVDDLMEELHGESSIMNHFPIKMYHIPCTVNFMMLYHALHNQLNNNYDEKDRKLLHAEITNFKKWLKDYTDYKNNKLVKRLKHCRDKKSLSRQSHGEAILEEFNGEIPEGPAEWKLEATFKKIMNKTEKTEIGSKRKRTSNDEENENENENEEIDENEEYDDNKKSKNDAFYKEYMDCQYDNAVNTIKLYHNFQLKNGEYETLFMNPSRKSLKQSVMTVNEAMKKFGSSK